MPDFIRARSAEQKEQRLDQIKDVARRQFSEHPYHEITLSTIADELGWSRANLYKYVRTKEEIFLLLSSDECVSYYQALLAALPEGCGLAPEVVAEVWAGIANAHRDYFRLGDLLFTIVETNVTLARLVEYKRCYYDMVSAMAERLPKILPIDADRVSWLLETAYHHAVGLTGTCASNPLVAQALDELGVERPVVDFRAEMSDFIGMCLAHCAR
ncbi:TetR family transcriptional regulator [Olsenella profusa]|uniref:TetR family transcriptional regulator n=1 Tax=Olsenella profusa TaxID=138595 RepID=A0ABS2F0X9_9ACTN|nr:TetR family transcriptional regulator [Olsenella profusa]MBM6774184.1 TetR family transcriptional regulator [Olsenella profusa]